MPRRPFLLLDKAQNLHLFCLKTAGFVVPFQALAILLLTDHGYEGSPFLHALIR